MIGNGYKRYANQTRAYHRRHNEVFKHLNMATIAMMVGGAIVDALAFSGNNYLFSSMRGDEQKRHYKALEQLETAQSQWARRRMLRLDLINDELRKEGHSIQTFKDVESAMHEYFLVYGMKLGLIPRPTISQFDTPSETQKKREIAFIILGLSTMAIFSYVLLRINH